MFGLSGVTTKVRRKGFRHLSTLRRRRSDRGWIRVPLIVEATNARDLVAQGRMRSMIRCAELRSRATPAVSDHGLPYGRKYRLPRTRGPHLDGGYELIARDALADVAICTRLLHVTIELRR